MGNDDDVAAADVDAAAVEPVEIVAADCIRLPERSRNDSVSM